MHWFTSDLHLGHKNILRFCPERNTRCREWLGLPSPPTGVNPEGPKRVSILDHDRWIIGRMKEQSKPGDTIWHLGDLSLSGVERGLGYLRALSEALPDRRLFLLGGNHDFMTLKKLSQRGELPEDMEYLGHPEEPRTYSECLFALCHYPRSDWPGHTIHLHGHTHTAVKSTMRRRVHVGWDAWHGLASYPEICAIAHATKEPE